MQGAVLITWGSPTKGREAKSLESFGKAVEYYSELAKEGRIHGHREYFCITGPAYRAGFLIIDGEIDELQKIMVEDRNLRLLTEARAVVDDIDVTLCAGGSDQSVSETVSRFTETLATLGYM